ncbi:DotU family type IV/VI secretion system protein [uncultured Rhodoferax sp.]|uniref:DotU family type IV/VI secretion system protein n=1 Tax=uncultured Rhodoferax sp. TaxID=223188 RepID=UPI0025E2DBFE|nr:DotU family type IV/VI secretion system protein [uncultured Rhodoferax sp.]
MARPTRDKHEDDHLIAQFRAFFAEVSRAQTRAVEMREINPDAAAAAVSKDLEQLIELQTLESKREGSRFELQSIADARYLKAALADEVLLNTDWIGRDRWTDHLLEASLFRTSFAGDRIFEKIDELLSNREPSLRPIASLYLFALALGFQGRFRGAAASERFTGYRAELFQFVYQRQADLSGRDRVLSERAYASTLSHISPRKMPTLSRWSVIFLVGVLGLLAVSELLWLWQSWPVREVLQVGQGLGQEASK